MDDGDIDVVLNDVWARLTAGCQCMTREMPDCMELPDNNAVVDGSHVKALHRQRCRCREGGAPTLDMVTGGICGVDTASEVFVVVVWHPCL